MTRSSRRTCRPSSRTTGSRTVRVDEFDAYSYYYAVNLSKLPNLKHRQAIAVALDRAQIRTIQGGSFGGDLADGVIKPNLPQDYAPSEMWSGLLGQEIPDTGDPEFAKKLIAGVRRADADDPVRLRRHS